MDRLGFFIGLVALAISLFPDAISPDHARYLFWIGIICLVWGGVALLRAYINLTFVWNLINGRFPLLAVLETAREQLSSGDQDKLLDHVLNLARSGRVIIYGEHGSGKQLVPIPAAYFATHGLGWSRGTRTLSTVDPTRSMGDQDSDDLFFNLHVNKKMSLIWRGLRA